MGRTEVGGPDSARFPNELTRSARVPGITRRARWSRDLAHLHGDTLDLARQGNLITKNNALTEKGEIVNGVGDTPNRHDILTGSQPDGRAYTDGADHTCRNWTSEASDGAAQVGHHDRNGGGISWNSVHPSRGCSQANLAASGGAGLFFCFAVTGN